MIALIRVDNRLLHGQILEAWVPRLRIRAIVVADDDAARSPLARAAMTLALPPGLGADVRAVEEVDWASLARSPDATLVIFRDLADLARAVGAGLVPQQAPVVNLGNIHYVDGRRPVTPSVFLSRAELETVLALARRGFDVEARAVPADVPVGPAAMEERYTAAT